MTIKTLISTHTHTPHQVREWSSKLRKQTYLLDRQIRSIQREEAKVKLSLKQAAKKGDKDVCLILAKEIVNSRKAVNRINTSKAQLNSVSLHMQQQAAALRVAGCMQKSAEVMKAMHSLVKVHEISDVMRELAKEMTKAGIMEELMEETMESTSGIEEEEMEEEVQKEVDKVLFELTQGKSNRLPVVCPFADHLSHVSPSGQLGAAPEVVSDDLRPTPAAAASEPEEEEGEIEEMKKRLEALKS